ncbi:acyl-CoA thioester hydrolase [Bacillus ectoiniformans]|uniref:acyl-CoA thioesterase n=1 Tax=Bacillus ectoiniformans TaxID=1494429 RepID=UPI00195DB761|nr:thioesterase family protein [Bacillus ectoiniformans]MBM7647699.1 acyl-CoA thioester hydrolase [Bacillus ectoiniformans]
MHETLVRVRFCETDAIGHINNVSYFIYLEDARIQFMEAMGAGMDIGNWEFILANVDCDFVAQGYFKQELTIKTFVTRIGNKSFTLGHEIVDTKTDQLIAKGTATMVYFDFENQQSVAIPEEVKTQLKSNFIETAS